MILYRCDGCGREMDKTKLRYTVSIDVRAAYNEIEVGLADLVKDHRSEIIRLIEQMRQRDPQEIEEEIYKKISLDLCPTCQSAFIRNPLRFHPEQGAPNANVDIDAFLRSLGYGKTKDDGEDAPD